MSPTVTVTLRQKRKEHCELSTITPVFGAGNQRNAIMYPGLVPQGATLQSLGPSCLPPPHPSPAQTSSPHVAVFLAPNGVFEHTGLRKPSSVHSAEHTALQHPPHSHSRGTSAKPPAPGHTAGKGQGPGLLLRPSCFHHEPRCLDPPLHVRSPTASLQSAGPVPAAATPCSMHLVIGNSHVL